MAEATPICAYCNDHGEYHDLDAELVLPCPKCNDPDQATPCSTCGGEGRELPDVWAPGKEPATCPTCDGSGRVVPCGNCEGSGVKLPKGRAGAITAPPCSRCGGSGTLPARQT